MGKTKIDFIADLLASNQLKASHKEKFIALAIEELRKSEKPDSNIEKRIEQLEEVVLSLKPNQTKTEKIKSPIEHTPKKTIEALRLFDTSLKYFTHKWDKEEEFKREEEIERANEILKTITVPFNLRSRIHNFINKNEKKTEGEPEWYVHHLFGKTIKCYYSWNNPAFVEWFNNSISKDITSPLINEKMISPFKHSIQIRDRQLEKHINPLVEKVLYKDGKTEYDVKYINLEQAKFYTNTQELMKGIKKLLEESVVKNAKINDRYKIKFEYVDRDRSLRIVHIKSKCSYSSTNPDLIGGSLKDIRESSFISLCNWSIDATFSDGNKRINILTDNDSKPVIEDLDYTPEGFTHILYFY